MTTQYKLLPSEPTDDEIIFVLEQIAKELEECAGVSWTLFDGTYHRVKVVSHRSYEDAIAYIRRRIDSIKNSIKRKQQDADRNT